MRTSLNINNKLTMISEMRNDTIFQVLEYDDLEGANNLSTSIQLDFMKKSGVKLKQVRIILDESAVKLEAGALSYMKGDIEIINKVNGVRGFGKKFFSSKVTGESTFKPIFQGKGEIFLEPSFGHYALIELEDEEIIVDGGLFYACEETVDVKATMQKNISAMVFGDEGAYQTKLSGSGIVLLEIPIPEQEILRCKMYRDTLKVDGNFALLRTANIEFTVEKSGTSLIGTALNGEGLLNVYRGTGEVWLAPTKGIYDDLNKRGLSGIIKVSKDHDEDI
ncbi:AIM24 family protein [Clostridium chauvoei]|uniref:AIM24 family protein n=1 Tax=Clostridium chauvoei TaxID=46867 RepID=UPI001C8504BD|nr:AIM24 family protein [Clostridium chauvoei]MBX7330773.1 AIM24 family protein [Clostridium chauvoei]